jgi:FkbH-like protein
VIEQGRHFIDEFHKILAQKHIKPDVITLNSKSSTVLILSNQTIRIMERRINSILNSLSINVDLRYGPYDDSLQILPEVDADLCLIVYDVERNQLDEKLFVEWFEKALRQINEKYRCRVVCAPTGKRFWQSPDQVLQISKRYSWLYIFVPRNLEKFISSTQLIHDSLNIPKELVFSFAEEITMKALATSLGCDIRAVMCDVDNTLFEGVVGEDGIGSIQLDSSNYQLQTELVEIVNDGVPVYLVSKNNLNDVTQLLEMRTDFPLSAIRDQLFIHASWESKDIVISKILREINLNPANCLFIDDNYFELLRVKDSFPTMKFWHYFGEYRSAIRLHSFPGIERMSKDSESSRRITDLKVRASRILGPEVNSLQRLCELNTQITLNLNNIENLSRLSQLIVKTNQFNCTLRRTSLDFIEQEVASGDLLFITGHVKDDLSDSGIVFGMVERRGEILELLMSCRILGRGLEDLLVASAVSLLGLHNGAANLSLDFTNGPRNQPAAIWWNQFPAKRGKIIDMEGSMRIYQQCAETLHIKLISDL